MKSACTCKYNLALNVIRVATKYAVLILGIRAGKSKLGSSWPAAITQTDWVQGCHFASGLEIVGGFNCARWRPIFFKSPLSGLKVQQFQRLGFWDLTYSSEHVNSRGPGAQTVASPVSQISDQGLFRDTLMAPRHVCLSYSYPEAPDFVQGKYWSLRISLV